MAWKDTVEPVPLFQYAVYEVMGDTGTFVGGFDMLTGAEQEISSVSYKIIDPNGHVITRYMPGQTKYTAFELLRAVDIGAQAIFEKFADARTGKLKDLRKNYSVSMNDSDGKPLVWWDLINAIPVKISGFSFNEKTESVYTDFTVYLQPEEVIISFK